MVRLANNSVAAMFALLAASVAGCGSTRFGTVLQGAPAADQTSVIHASLLAPLDETLEPDQQLALPDTSLSVDALVAEVLARNPSLTQMVAAWQAASARYPQVRSLDDPMLGGTIAPASFGSNTVAAGYRVEIAQKIPFPGKLRLRGDAALAEASAAGNDVDDMRLQLIETTKQAYYEYFLADRAISVNDASLKLLKSFRDHADARLKTPLGSPQEVLQADVEIGKQQERGLILQRMRNVAVARINTLRSLPLNEPLKASPESLKIDAVLPSVEALRDYARAQRPDIKALDDRIRAEQSTLALARREYWPDAEFAAGYDSIMGNGPMRDLGPQVSVRLNVPLQFRRRQAAVAEAEAKVMQKQAELSARINQIDFQVQDAYEQLKESEKVLALYEKTILPRAQENVDAAVKAYIGTKIPFLSLIEAQRNLVSLQDRNYEATADYFRRLANLERAIGGSLAAFNHTSTPDKK